MPLGGCGDDDYDYDDDVRWKEQDMPYLSRDRRRAEGGEGNVDDGVDGEHVNGRVRGPHRADTGDGRWWRSRRDSDNDDDVEEGGSHPTPLTTATRELAARLCLRLVLTFRSWSREKKQALARSPRRKLWGWRSLTKGSSSFD